MAQILAHRGASKERPENTMAAFRRAQELGAYGIETDVHLLMDGTLAVHHDSELGRCENRQGSIYEYNRERIKSFSAGAWFSPAYADERVPCLEELLAFAREKDLFLNIEIKRGTGFYFGDIGVRTVSMVKAYGLAERCVFSSFQHDILSGILEHFPDACLGALYEKDFGMDMIAYARENGFCALHPHASAVNPAFVRRTHDAGIQVNVWTVDEPEQIREMLAAGVDGIITNDPAGALAVCGQEPN